MSCRPIKSLFSVHDHVSSDTTGRLEPVFPGQPGTFRGPWGSNSISPYFVPEKTALTGRAVASAVEGTFHPPSPLHWGPCISPVKLLVCGLCQCPGIPAPSSTPKQVFAFLIAQRQNTGDLPARNPVKQTLLPALHNTTHFSDTSS